jgi:hypothetical protein
VFVPALVELWASQTACLTQSRGEYNSDVWRCVAPKIQILSRTETQSHRKTTAVIIPLLLSLSLLLLSLSLLLPSLSLLLPSLSLLLLSLSLWRCASVRDKQCAIRRSETPLPRAHDLSLPPRLCVRHAGDLPEHTAPPIRSRSTALTCFGSCTEGQGFEP